MSNDLPFAVEIVSEFRFALRYLFWFCIGFFPLSMWCISSYRQIRPPVTFSQAVTRVTVGLLACGVTGWLFSVSMLFALGRSPGSGIDLMYGFVAMILSALGLPLILAQFATRRWPSGEPSTVSQELIFKRRELSVLQKRIREEARVAAYERRVAAYERREEERRRKPERIKELLEQELAQAKDALERYEDQRRQGDD